MRRSLLTIANAVLALALLFMASMSAPAAALDRPELRARSEAFGRQSSDLEKQAYARDLAFRVRILGGGGDPVADANAAAAKGRFQLIWSLVFVGEAPYGFYCLAPHAPNRSRVATVFVDDNLTPRSMAEDETLESYANAYNRTLLAHPAFPSVDICGLPRANAIPRFGPPFSVFKGPGVIQTRGLHQAAREGTKAEIRRWLEAGADLDAPDDFGMSPLAWAIARRRDDVALDLLARGADPVANIETLGHWNTPLALAIADGRHALARRLVNHTVLLRTTNADKLLEAAIDADWPDVVLGMLPTDATYGEWMQFLDIAVERGGVRTKRAMLRLKTKP